MMRRALAAPEHELSMVDRCRLLGMARSTLYYEAVGASDEELGLLRRLDELHLKWPFYGSRNLAWELSQAGRPINRKQVQRLMRVLGIESLAPKPNLSKPSRQHKVYPYLLRDMRVDRACQVWAVDITYIPLESGFCYLVAIIDWYSRKVLSWRLSNTLDSSFCVDALQAALNEFEPPDVCNSDQGVQFTSEAFISVLRNADIRISMDGKGRCLDNVFVERLWRSLKYEDVYLRRYSFMPEAAVGIGRYFNFFNSRRPHHAFQFQTPDAVFEESLRGRPRLAA
jgi:putative transposase